MLPFRLHPEADAEAIHAAKHIKENDLHEADLFKKAISHSIDWACSQPLIFQCFEKDFRKIRFGKFRYLLIFRIAGDEIQILAIAHTSREPDYWKKRSSHWE